MFKYILKRALTYVVMIFLVTSAGYFLAVQAARRTASSR